MPRRNRNAHALTIDADKLADQASQLTTELGSSSDVTICLADETQVYFLRLQGTGKSSGLPATSLHGSVIIRAARSASLRRRR